MKCVVRKMSGIGNDALTRRLGTILEATGNIWMQEWEDSWAWNEVFNEGTLTER